MAKRKMIGILFFALIAEMDLVIKNMINIFFVSHYLGAEGAAAYEVIMPCVMVASAVVALGFNGVQAICAKDYGAGDFDAFERHKNAGYTWIFRDINDFSIEQAKAFIKKVCDYAETYKETFIGFDDITSYSFSDGKIRLLQILDTVNITAFEPFILYTLKNSNEEQQNAIFAKLECYVMRHYIIGNSTKMGSFLQDAVEMIKGTFDFDTKLQDDLISDFRLERALRYINNTKAKLVLFWTELVVITTLLAIAVPPLPGSGFMIISTMLAQLGIPAEALLLITLCYVIVDYVISGVDVGALLLELTREAHQSNLLDQELLRTK